MFDDILYIPYSKLKENERAYEIMLLRDLYDNTFADMAREFETSRTRIAQIYCKIKIKQLRLYAQYLAAVHGHENASAFRINSIYDCYLDSKYVSAYFEKEYGDILTEYRSGEPGIPEQFIEALPPFTGALSAEVLDRMIQLREIERNCC